MHGSIEKGGTAMIKYIKPLPISEEMLGAYLEGNLSAEEAQCIEQLIETDECLSGLLDDVEELTLMEGTDSIYDDFPDFGEDYMLPEIPDTSDILGGFEEMVAAMPDFSPPIVENVFENNDVLNDTIELSAYSEVDEIYLQDSDIYNDDSDSFSLDDPYDCGDDLLGNYKLF